MGWGLETKLRFSWAIGIVIMLALVSGLALFAYHKARALRGQAPTEFAWVSPGEFEGV
jgi:hypothetical protein